MQASSMARTLTVGLSFLALTAIPGQAQTTLGVRGGVSVSSVELDLAGTFDDSNRTGFEGGVFLDFGRSRPLGFQIGAQYAQKGAELDFEGVVEDLTLNYLEIPAVVKLGIPLLGLKPSVFGGAALGFQTGCDDIEEIDCDEDVTSTNVSGILGADVVLDLGGLSLWADGRFHFGLSDIADAVDIDELKTRAWTLQAGLGFPLGG